MKYLKLIIPIFLLLVFLACQKENTRKANSFMYRAGSKSSVIQYPISKGKMVVDTELDEFMNKISKLPLKQDSAVQSFMNNRKIANTHKSFKVKTINPNNPEDKCSEISDLTIDGGGGDLRITSDEYDQHTYAVTWTLATGNLGLFSINSMEQIRVGLNPDPIVYDFIHNGSTLATTFPIPASWGEDLFVLTPNTFPTYTRQALVRVAGQLSICAFTQGVDNYCFIKLSTY